LLAFPFDVSRQFSIALRFPLPLAFAVTFKSARKALAITFQVVPIHE
jgi:hypothetical protein